MIMGELYRPQKEKVYSRTCKRCKTIYNDSGRYSRICPKCRKLGGQQKKK